MTPKPLSIVYYGNVCPALSIFTNSPSEVTLSKKRNKNTMLDSYEIKPYTQVGRIPTDRTDNRYPLAMVLPVVGMNEYFVKKVLGRHEDLTEDMVVELLEQDAFSETFVPRSKVLQYLRKEHLRMSQKKQILQLSKLTNCTEVMPYH